MICVIILNWKQWHLTAECILSLLEQAPLPDHAIHIIVVDNGSDDGSIERLQEKFGEKITLLVNAKNLGYAGGNNVGIRHALAQGAKYIMVLNNDTVTGGEFFGSLLDRLESDPQIGVTAPKIYRMEPQDRLWGIGGTINWWLGTAHNLGRGELDMGQFSDPCQLDYATGCCFLARREVFISAGLLDEQFFAYFEDADWSMRVRKCHWQIWYEPNSTLHHWAGASSRSTTGKKQEGVLSPFVYYLVSRNNMWFLRRHAKGIHLPVGLTMFMLRHVLYYSLAFIALRRWAKLQHLWRGVVDGLQKLDDSKITQTTDVIVSK